jgi:hypothetical protein
VEVVTGEECAVDSEQSAQSMETAQTEHSAQGGSVIAQPPRRRGMHTKYAAQNLVAQIRRDYPAISLSICQTELGLYLVGLQIADDQWYDLEGLGDWTDPTEQTQLAIDAAEAYARQRAAAQSNDGYSDSQGPPGYDEASEGGCCLCGREGARHTSPSKKYWYCDDCAVSRCGHRVEDFVFDDTIDRWVDPCVLPVKPVEQRELWEVKK